MKTENLVFELLTEELPPKALQKLGAVFAQQLTQSLRHSGLLSEGSLVKTFATPRRLGLHISQVMAHGAVQTVKQKIMPVNVALNQGAPTPALLKKLAALKLDEAVVPELVREHDGKNEVLVYIADKAGETLQDALQKAVLHALAKLPIPKVMSYQLADGWSDVKFVRPAHKMMALYGSEIVNVAALGLLSGRTTLGHRFESLVAEIEIKHADEYESTLLDQGRVIASFEARQIEINQQMQDACLRLGSSSSGLHVVPDAALLDEVTALVEYPNVLTCQFEQGFLAVPSECLILTMKANQKYFPLVNADGSLSNHFLVVSNLSPADTSSIRSGNEKVVRPRLADAKFFYDQDRKKSLESRRSALKNVVYHNLLGSQFERNGRMVEITKSLAEKLLKSGSITEVDGAQAVRAVMLCKCDLLTDMVGEFPELQGIMGAYYAQHDGEGIDIAMAIEDHYKPRFAGDTLPRSTIGALVALADKLETITGMFAIGNAPSGDKDPFALRRHALGVIRILLDKKWTISSVALIELALGVFTSMCPKLGDESDQAKVKIKEEIAAFFHDRLTGMLKDLGYSTQEVEAVLEVSKNDWPSVLNRLAAVKKFQELSAAPLLAAANKRISNILKKAEKVDMHVSAVLLCEPAEKALFEELNAVKIQSDALFSEARYVDSLTELAKLGGAVDQFFSDVMVNCEQLDVRLNRITLLELLYQTMNRVADLGKLAG